MAKILFTVCGVGLGHASRSQIILQELAKKHEIVLTSYTDGFDFLKKDFPAVKRLEWFSYYFDNNRIARLKTILFNLPRVPFVLVKNFFSLKRIIKDFRPDVIISDFDSNGLYAGKIFGVPVILVSNMHLAEYFRIKLGFWDMLAFELSDHLMLRAYFCADQFLITSVMKPEEKSKNRFFFYPIVRNEIRSLKPVLGDFFLCYVSKDGLAPLLPLLKNFYKKKFVVYGFGKKESEKNIVFRDFSKNQWIKDISECRGLICHGGLLSISEAVVLKKPVFVGATKDWFERFHNGKMVESLGFGKMQETPTFEGLKEFFDKNDQYINSLEKRNIVPSNEEFFKKLGELIEKNGS